MNFFLSMIPPTVTAQMHKVTAQHGRVRFYDTKELKEARRLFVMSLLQYSPESPIEGAIALTTVWYFPTKSHKEGGYKITRPDTDNLQKLLKDCMTAAGFWKDDAQVCDETVRKFWTRVEPGIWISIESLEDA